MANNNIECPVDFIPVNENKVRLTALGVFLLALAYILSGFWPLAAFLLIDFFLRAFNWGKYSLLNMLAGILVKFFSIKNKPIDQAPKRFAAKIGFGLTVVILICHFSGGCLLAKYVAAVLVLFSFLESFLGFCAGCYVYTFYKKIFPAKTVKKI